MRERGKVKFFNEDRGFGFITRDDNTDWFVHITQTGSFVLQKGERIEFDIGPNDRSGKLQAINVEVLEGDSQ